jgi:hypothetical protein
VLNMSFFLLLYCDEMNYCMRWKICCEKQQQKQNTKKKRREINRGLLHNKVYL